MDRDVGMMPILIRHEHPTSTILVVSRTSPLSRAARVTMAASVASAPAGC
jgi:hypothetical protein